MCATYRHVGLSIDYSLIVGRNRNRGESCVFISQIPGLQVSRVRRFVSREFTGQGNFNVSLDHRFSLKLLVVLLTCSRSITVFVFWYPHGWLRRADKGSTYILRFIAMTDHSSMTEGHSGSRLRLIERQGRWFVVDKYMVEGEQIV